MNINVIKKVLKFIYTSIQIEESKMWHVLGNHEKCPEKKPHKKSYNTTQN